AVLRGAVIALTPDKSAAGQKVQHALVRQPLGVLQDGVTYYVRDAGTPGQFKLAAFLGGPALDVNDVGRSGLHGFGKAGIELTPTNGPVVCYPGVGSVVSGTTVTVNNPGLGNGDAVVYQAPPPLAFNAGMMDTTTERIEFGAPHSFNANDPVTVIVDGAAGNV